jgi:hypothetical protein
VLATTLLLAMLAGDAVVAAIVVEPEVLDDPLATALLGVPCSPSPWLAAHEQAKGETSSARATCALQRIQGHGGKEVRSICFTGIEGAVVFGRTARHESSPDACRPRWSSGKQAHANPHDGTGTSLTRSRSHISNTLVA